MDALIQFLKQVSDPVRLKILIALKEKSFCVCELVSLLGEPQPKISKHLIKFKDLGIVSSSRQEKFIYYSLTLSDEFLSALLELLSTYKDLEIDTIKRRIQSNESLVCKREL